MYRNNIKLSTEIIIFSIVLYLFIAKIDWENL